MSNILPKDISKVIYTQKLIISKKFDNLAKINLRVTETGPSRILTYVSYVVDVNPGPKTSVDAFW